MPHIRPPELPFGRRVWYDTGTEQGRRRRQIKITAAEARTAARSAPQETDECGFVDEDAPVAVMPPKGAITLSVRIKQVGRALPPIVDPVET